MNPVFVDTSRFWRWILPEAFPTPPIPCIYDILPDKYYCVTRYEYVGPDCLGTPTTLVGICVLGQTILDESPVVEPCLCYYDEASNTSVAWDILWGPFDDPISCSYFCGAVSSSSPSPAHGSDEYQLCEYNSDKYVECPSPEPVISESPVPSPVPVISESPVTGPVFGTGYPMPPSSSPAP